MTFDCKCSECQYRHSVEDTDLYCCGIHQTTKDGFFKHGGEDISKKLLIVNEDTGCTWGRRKYKEEPELKWIPVIAEFDYDECPVCGYKNHNLIPKLEECPNCHTKLG